MKDPYRVPGEKEPEPIKPWLNEKRKAYIQLVASIASVVILFGYISISMDNDEKSRANTCEVDVSSSKFRVVYYNEKGKEVVQSFHDNRKEAEADMKTLEVCSK